MLKKTAEENWVMLMCAALGWALFLIGVSAAFGACVSGCSVFGAKELPAPCDTLTLATLKADCHRRVRATCQRDVNNAVDENCGVLKECDARIRAWHRCDADAGAP